MIAAPASREAAVRSRCPALHEGFGTDLPPLTSLHNRDYERLFVRRRACVTTPQQRVPVSATSVLILYGPVEQGRREEQEFRGHQIACL
jgi:hypothetical protein